MQQAVVIDHFFLWRAPYLGAANRNCFCVWRGLAGGVEIARFCTDRGAACVLVPLTIPELWTFF